MNAMEKDYGFISTEKTFYWPPGDWDMIDWKDVYEEYVL